MKIKTIRLTLRVPCGYRWLATQPWGERVAFKRKPKIIIDYFDARYWDTQKDELSLFSDSMNGLQGNCPNWEKSLRSLVFK